MKIQIESKRCVTIEKTYHFNISIDNECYFFIVQTVFEEDNQIIVSIKRGITYWDCCKKLTKKQKKEIKLIIERMF